MKKTLKEIFPAIIGVLFWIIFLGVIYLRTRNNIVLFVIIFLVIVSIISTCIVVIGDKLINYPNLQQKQNGNLDASARIKAWRYEHPPWM